MKNNMNSLLRCGLLAWSIFGLWGCGGGGSTDTTDVQPPPNVPAPNPVNKILQLDFDEPSGTAWTLEQITDSQLPITTQAYIRESVPGLDNLAWRTNGHTNWMEFDTKLSASNGFTLQFWIALESYPADIEIPYENRIEAALISQIDSDSGFSIDINTYGQWKARVFIDQQLYTLTAPDVFPLYQWNQVALSVNTEEGTLALLLNDSLVATRTIPAGQAINFSDSKLLIGRANEIRSVGPLTLSAINGAYDKLVVFDQSIANEVVFNEYRSLIGNAATIKHALSVPDIRFSQDIHRPRLHPMPPANWTNEPHGLVLVDGVYHMFYQRTSNLPYKTQSHWGHMMSQDLVHWEHTENAIIPSVDATGFGFDMKGIWSGDVWFEEGTSYAFYTSVNHGNQFNPGISVATSNESNLTHWQKSGPILDAAGTRDFRDPYIFKDNQNYHMIVGAAYNQGGGLAHYVSSELTDWAPAKTFSSIAFEQMDINSTIWEMPIFEKLDENKYILSVTPIGNQVIGDSLTNPTRSIYWIGAWDGEQFTPDDPVPKNVNVVHGLLSPTITRTTDDRLVTIGIVDEKRNSYEQFAAGWTQTFSLARQWFLMPDGHHLGQKPIAELVNLRKSQLVSNTDFVIDDNFLIAQGRQLEIELMIDPLQIPEQFSFVLGTNEQSSEKTLLTYTKKTRLFELDTTYSSVNSNVFKQVRSNSIDTAVYGEPTHFQLFVDHSNVSVFINKALAFSFRMYPSLLASQQAKFITSESVGIDVLNVWELGSNDQIPNEYERPVTIKEIAQGVKIRGDVFDSILGDFDNAFDMLQLGWEATGDFSNPSTSNSWIGTSGVTKIGPAAVSTCEINNNQKGCDGAKGELTSPIFAYSEATRFLNLLVSGGNGTNDVKLVLVDAQTHATLETYHPDNCTPSYIDGNDDWFSFDLYPYEGQQMQLKIIDNESSACGFISFDHVHFTSKRLR